LSTTTTPSKILSAFTPSSTTCNSPPPFSRAKVSTNCFCTRSICELRRWGVWALTKVQLLLTNYCQTLSSMITWMTFCPSPPPMSFENGHAKLGLTQPFLSLVVGHCREQCLIASIFITFKASYHNLPNPNQKSNMEFFHLWTTLWVIHLVPKTNLITSKIVDETLFRFGVYLGNRKISQLLCHLGDGGGSFLTCTLFKTSHDTFGWTMKLYMYIDRPLSDLK
jgi:hypothetical protein